MSAQTPSELADTSEVDWHGWSRGGIALHVGYLPGRKSVCLYSHVGSTIRTHAFFRDEDQALAVLNILDHLLRVAGHGNKRVAQFDGEAHDG